MGRVDSDGYLLDGCRQLSFLSTELTEPPTKVSVCCALLQVFHFYDIFVIRREQLERLLLELPSPAPPEPHVPSITTATASVGVSHEHVATPDQPHPKLLDLDFYVYD